MPLAEHREITPEEYAAGIVLTDPLLFARYFHADELSLPMKKEQKLMFCDQSKNILLCTARKTVKTVCLESRVLHKLCTHYRADGGMDEAMFVTPTEKIMNQFCDRLTTRINKRPLLKTLVTRMRGGEDRTYESKYLRYYMRIEGSSGTDTNMVGLRAIEIIGDEMQLGSHVCYKSRQQTLLPGATQILAGVPNGVRTTPFWELDQTKLGAKWSRHKYNSFINPIFDDPKEAIRLAEMYGGKKTQGYINNVLGEWGEEAQSSFPPGSIAMHSFPYFVKRIYGLDDVTATDVALKVAIPSIRCAQFAIGWDYGLSPDPSIVYGVYKKTDADDVWYGYCKIEMRRVAIQNQVAVVQHIIDRVFDGKFIALSSDKVDVIQLLQAGNPNCQEKFIRGNPAGTTKADIGEEALVSVRNKEYQTTLLKTWMINAVVGLDGRKLWLGRDDEGENELLSTTERKTDGGYVQYFGPPMPGVRHGKLDHFTDSLRDVCFAIQLGTPTDGGNSEAELLAAMGWAGSPMPSAEMESGDIKSWNAPWGR